MAAPYFATGYLRLLYRFLRAQGAPAAALFAGTGFHEADLMQADVDMPFAAQMRLAQNGLDRAGQNIGLAVGHQLQLAAHGPLGTAMQCAPDLATALDTLARFMDIRASFLALDMASNASKAQIDISIRGLPAGLIPFFSESILFTLIHCISFYSGYRAGIGTIRLGYPDPGYGAGYALAFDNPVTFGGEQTRVALSRDLLSLPSPEHDAAAFADSVRRCEDQLSQLQPQGDIARSVETFLLENPGKLWTVEEIAPLFAMSPRTLIRQLKQRGTSYQLLRDALLKRQATSQLTSMTVESVAISLGFSDTSSFRRTFKRWFGVTPSRFQDEA